MTSRILSTVVLLAAASMAWGDELLHANTATTDQLEASAELSSAAVSAIVSGRPFAARMSACNCMRKTPGFSNPTRMARHPMAGLGSSLGFI